MKNKLFIFAIMFLVMIGIAHAAVSGTTNLNGYNRYWIKNYVQVQATLGNFTNITYSGSLPSECLLTNSFVTRFDFTTSTCRTLNYTAIIGYTYPSLAGTGNALLCVNNAGLIYRGNATGCP